MSEPKSDTGKSNEETTDIDTTEATPAKNRFERHPRLTLLFVVLILFAVVLAAVEWSLTLLHDRLELSAADARGEARVLRLREWAPGMVKVFAAPENRSNDPIGPVDPTYELRIDAHGFIAPSVVHDDPDLEIAFFGGSTTESLYVRPEMRFPHLAGRMLETRTGLKINALNAGKSGNTSMHAVLGYLGKVAPRRPQFVVLMEGANDIGLLNREKTYWNDDAARSLVVPERDLEGQHPVEAFFESLRDSTIPYTYARVRRGWDGLARSLGLAPPPETAPRATRKRRAKAAGRAPGKNRLKRQETLRASYEPSLRSFVRLAKAWGSTPVLMTQVRLDARDGEDGASDFLSPEELRKGNFDTASFGSMHDYANALVRHVAASEGAVLIDLAAARDWTREDVYDGIHFTQSGSRHVAEIIEQDLAPLILESERQEQRSRFSDGALP